MTTNGIANQNESSNMGSVHKTTSFVEQGRLSKRRKTGSKSRCGLAQLEANAYPDAAAGDLQKEKVGQKRGRTKGIKVGSGQKIKLNLDLIEKITVRKQKDAKPWRRLPKSTPFMLSQRSKVQPPPPPMKNYEDFDIIEKLGEGAYGVVSKAIFKPTGGVYAIKKVKLDQGRDGIPATTIREVALLKRCTHPNIVKLFSILYQKDNLHLVFELVKEDMHDHLSNYVGVLPLDTVKSWMVDMYLGLRFIHSLGVLHRDLKPQNILVSKEGTLKLADFGLGRECYMPVLTLTHEVVTLWYRCPEVLLGTEKYGYGVDSWSMGCILAELLSQSIPRNGTEKCGSFIPLFPGDSEIGQIFKIFQVTGTPNTELWQDCDKLKYMNMGFPQWEPISDDVWQQKVPRADVMAMDLLKRSLTLDPSDRLVAKDALEHPFLKPTLEAHHARSG